MNYTFHHYYQKPMMLPPCPVVGCKHPLGHLPVGVKYTMNVLDRNTGKVMLWQMPKKLYDQITQQMIEPKLPWYKRWLNRAKAVFKKLVSRKKYARLPL